MARSRGLGRALESEPALADAADAALTELGVSNAAVVRGPLEAGWPGEGPYDVIIVSGGAVDVVPDRLIDQLKDGGRRLIAVVGRGRAAPAILHTPARGAVGTRPVFDAALPKLPGIRSRTAFVFPFEANIRGCGLCAAGTGLFHPGASPVG